MKIIYHCYGGSHSSVVAAAIHLGMIPDDRLPSPQNLNNLPYYDGQEQKDHGSIRFIGVDELGNEVYILGRRNTAKFIEKTLYGMAEACGIPKNELLLINAMPYVNWRMVVGGFTSRRLGKVLLGRPIVMNGTLKSFFYFVGLVQRIKDKLRVWKKEGL